MGGITGCIWRMKEDRRINGDVFAIQKGIGGYTGIYFEDKGGWEHKMGYFWRTKWDGRIKRDIFGG